METSGRAKERARLPEGAERSCRSYLVRAKERARLPEGAERS